MLGVYIESFAAAMRQRSCRFAEWGWGLGFRVQGWEV